MNIKDILDNKKFWKNIKPLFSNKGTTGQKITLVKEKEIISEDSEVAETLNTFFKDVVKSLDLQIPVDLLNTVDMETYDPIDSIIKKFQFHPSILKIKEKVKPVIFKFSEVELGEVEK